MRRSKGAYPMLYAIRSVLTRYGFEDGIRGFTVDKYRFISKTFRKEATFELWIHISFKRCNVCIEPI